MATLIKGLTIYTEDQVLTNASLRIDNGKIVSINEDYSAEQMIECAADDILLPGMIDMHIHGANKADTMDANAESLQTICTALAAEGTTSFLATTMSEPVENISAALQATAKFCQNDYTGAEILGLHLEGPFISKKRIGAQREECVLQPDIELFKQWQKISDNLIKLVTIAPEEPEALALIKYLVSQKIIASIGHTDADYQQAMAGIEAGCSHATHLFNAMRGIHHREPNAIAALLNSDKVTASLFGAQDPSRTIERNKTRLVV